MKNHEKPYCKSAPRSGSADNGAALRTRLQAHSAQNIEVGVCERDLAGRHIRICVRGGATRAVLAREGLVVGVWFFLQKAPTHVFTSEISTPK